MSRSSPSTIGSRATTLAHLLQYDSVFGLRTFAEREPQGLPWYDNEWGYSTRLVELAQRVLVPVSQMV